MLPGVGAVIGGGLDLVETKVIADRAYKWFFMGDFSEASKEDNIIDIEDADLMRLSRKRNMNHSLMWYCS